MNDRLNMIVCIFEQKSPRISAFEIHEWIYDTLRLPEREVRMIQIDGTRRHVYIKLSTNDHANEINNTAGKMTYKHDNGEISTVRIEIAGMGTRKIRITDLPPEVTDQAISRAFTSYGEVLDIHHETWSNVYRYKVPNGIRTALTTIKKHIPSRMAIAGHRVTISYEGQPPTCFGCSGADHQYQHCPNHKRRDIQKSQTTNTWADIVQQGTQKSQATPENQENSERIAECATTQHDPQRPLC